MALGQNPGAPIPKMVPLVLTHTHMAFRPAMVRKIWPAKSHCWPFSVAEQALFSRASGSAPLPGSAVTPLLVGEMR